MPYSIRKQKCKQSDGDSGSYTLSYTDNKGKKHRACHTSRKKARGQIAAIEGPREGDQSIQQDSEMSELYLRQIVHEILIEAKTSSKSKWEKTKPDAEVSVGSFNSWNDYDDNTSYEGKSGIGPGELKLASIFGGDVQGQNSSFDLSIPSGALAGQWEVKAPDDSGLIRTATKGLSTFGPVNKILITAFDELQELVSYPDIEKLADRSGSSELFKKISSFMKSPDGKSGRSDYDLLRDGELTPDRLKRVTDVIQAVSKLKKNMQGELLKINVNKKTYTVAPANMVKLSRLLGIGEDELTNELGDAADAAIALSSLNSSIFDDPNILKTAWESVSADEVFNLTGVILVTPRGFMPIVRPYGDKIKLHKISQGKPKFKTEIKGPRKKS